MNDRTLNHLPQGHGVDWLSRTTFRLQGQEFKVQGNKIGWPVGDAQIDESTLFLAKTAGIIREYTALLHENRNFRNIVELGIFRGGSVALLQLLAKPEKMLAMELSTTRVAPLDRFIEGRGLGGSVRAEYGVDQADKDVVNRLTSEHLGTGRCIDLVLDDASHLLAPSRSSFEALFPKVRPHGSYIIEDFSAAQIATSEWLDEASGNDGTAKTRLTLAMEGCLEADRRPLHCLAVEAMLASIAYPEYILKVICDRYWLRIVRGPKDIEDPGGFDLRSLARDDFGLLGNIPSEAMSSFLDDI